MSEGPPALVVLAAGMGSRYGGLKQVEAVNGAGEAIVDYSVYDALRAGFGKVVFVIRAEIEAQFRNSVGRRFERHVDVAYAFQELDSLPRGFTVPPGRTKPWGTLHAALAGAEQVSGSFAVINADDFYGANSYCALFQHLRSASQDSAMVGFTLRNTLSDFGPVSRGICNVDDHRMLRSTVERTKIVRDGDGARTVDDDGRELLLTGDEIVSMNMWGFRSSMVELLRQSFNDFLRSHGSDLCTESYLPTAVSRITASRESRVRVLQTDDAWCGITYPEDYTHVVARIAGLTRQGLYPERLWT